MKLFDLYVRILKKQIWLYALYLGIFVLMILLAWDMGQGQAMGKQVFWYYRYAVIPLMVLVMLTISAVTAVTSDLDLALRHRAAPVRMELLELTYLGADLVVMLFWWMLFFWTAVVLYGEAAYSAGGLLMALNLLTISLFSMAVGFLIGLFAKSPQTRGIFSTLMALALPLAGGSVELANVGDQTVYLLRSFTPAFWYQRALEEISGGRGTEENLKSYAAYIGVQLMFTLAVFTLGLMLEKQRKVDLEG